MSGYAYVHILHTHPYNLSAPSCYSSTALFNDCYSVLTTYTAIANSYGVSVYDADIYTETILRNQAHIGRRPSPAWFKIFVTDGTWWKLNTRSIFLTTNKEIKVIFWFSVGLVAVNLVYTKPFSSTLRVNFWWHCDGRLHPQ